MTDSFSKFDLNRHTARLLFSEPFFAALSRRVDKRANRGIPTAGVRVNPNSGYFELIYNPDFFAKLTDKEMTGVLKHEFYHLIFEHVTGDRINNATGDTKITKRWNIATDLAINSNLIGELPEGALYPEKGPFEDFEVGLSAEQYYALLKDKEEEQEQNGKDGESGEEGEEGEEGQGSGGGDGEGDDAGNGFDDHSGWGDVDNSTNEIAKQRLNEVLKKAAEEASRANSWGSIPSECRQEILDRLTAKIDWRKVLRYFIKTSQRANKSTTIKRINRRYAYIHPGKKINRQASIAISIDQSGSVGDDMLAAFFSELNKLAELAEFTVIPFDSEVATDSIYVWKKGEKRKWERVRYGGTDFDPPTKYVNEHKFDGHIILTDMYAAKPVASKCQRMWMTTAYYAKNPYFQTNERVVAIED
jgi:predicted metal-dependent peptidase